MNAAIEKNFPQREIANASYEYQKAVELGEKLVVGVNAFQSDGAEPIEILQIDLGSENFMGDEFPIRYRARRLGSSWGGLGPFRG